MESDKLHEECGVFGVWSTKPIQAASWIYYGLTALQHRGQEAAGIVVGDTKSPIGNICVHKGMGLVSEVFSPATLAGMLTGLMTGIFHTFMGIPAILSGILTQLSLYSINLKIMGKANQAINVDKYELLVSLRYIKGVPFYQNTIFLFR